MDSDAIDLRRIFDLLRRRLWLIVAVTAVAIGIAGAAVLVLKPVYTASALVLVDPRTKNLLDPDTQLSGGSSDSLRVDSEVELVKSETVLLAVAEELNLASDPEFGLSLGLTDLLLAFFRIAEPTLPTGEQALRAVLGNLREAVSVQRRGATFLITISARSGRPDLAATIANAVSRAYIQEQLQAKIRSTLDSRDIIQARIADSAASLAQSESAFDEFINQNIDRISEATGRTNFRQIRNEIDTLVARRASTSSSVEVAERSLATRDWAAVASSLQDEAVSNLERQRVALLGSLTGLAEGSQAAIDIRASLASVETELDNAARRAVTGVRDELANVQTRVAQLRTQLRGAILDSELPADILTSLYELQQSAEIARAQYQSMLTRQSDLDTQAFLQVADSRLAAEATNPDRPSFPNPRLMLLLAGMVGLGLGLGLAVIVENFLGGFTSEEQVGSVLKVPVISSVPRQKAIKRAGGESPSVADAMIVAPLSAYAEMVRRVRIGVDQATRVNRENRTDTGLLIMATSAAPNEGKTTLALSLARTYAMSGASTLLIDCDLRKPSVHRQLGMEPSGGLFEYLTGGGEGIDLKAIIATDASSGARVLLGSRRSDVATDQLVFGKTFSRLVAAARKSFDVVILDTPPIGPVVDALYLAGNADAIVFVVKWSSTPQQEVKAAISRLMAAKPEDTPLLAVLNQQAGNPVAYRGRYASYYDQA